jgi:hypothetical protein
MVWVARFLILRGRGPALAVFAVLPSNYQPSSLVCSAEILGCGATVSDKTAAAIADPG